MAGTHHFHPFKKRLEMEFQVNLETIGPPVWLIPENSGSLPKTSRPPVIRKAEADPKTPWDRGFDLKIWYLEKRASWLQGYKGSHGAPMRVK